MADCGYCGEHIGYYDEDDCVYFSTDGVYVHDEEKWDYINDRFINYLKNNNVEARVKEMQANPNLDAVIKLEKELNEAGADWNGIEPADTNEVGCVVGPLYDIQQEMKMGMSDPDEVLDLFRHVLEGIDEALHGETKLPAEDRKFLHESMKIRGSLD